MREPTLIPHVDVMAGILEVELIRGQKEKGRGDGYRKQGQEQRTLGEKTRSLME